MKKDEGAGGVGESEGLRVVSFESRALCSALPYPQPHTPSLPIRLQRGLLDTSWEEGVRGSGKREGTKFLGWGNPVAILEATVSHEPHSMVGNVLSPWLLLESSIAMSGLIP